MARGRIELVLRPNVLKVCLLTGSLTLFFGLCEVLVRVLLPAPQLVRVMPAPDLGKRLQREHLQETRLSMAHRSGEGGLYVETAAGRRLRSNTLAVIESHRHSGRRIEIRTNSLGYRNREIGPKQGTRILFLGDSITFGDFLPEEETFVRLVETRAQEAGRDWETINAGVGAISLENELSILNETGLGVEPDVVVVGFYLNDFIESQGVYVMRLPKLLERSRLLQYLAHLFPSERFAPSSVRRSERTADLEEWLTDFDRNWPSGKGDFQNDKSAFNELIRRHFSDWGGAWSEHAWARMTPLVVELQRLSRIHEFQLYLVVFPVVEQVVADYVYDYPQQRLNAIGESLEIEVLDLLPVLRQEHRRISQPLFYDGCHHTPAGAALVAKAVHSFLDRHLEESSPDLSSGESGSSNR